MQIREFLEAFMHDEGIAKPILRTKLAGPAVKEASELYSQYVIQWRSSYQEDKERTRTEALSELDTVDTGSGPMPKEVEESMSQLLAVIDNDYGGTSRRRRRRGRPIVVIPDP
jgi:hypothetical protein